MQFNFRPKLMVIFLFWGVLLAAFQNCGKGFKTVSSTKLASLKAPSPVLDVPAGQILGQCNFAGSLNGCLLSEQAKASPRASFVNVAGRSGIRLLTLVGDSNVFGSGVNERNDLSMSSVNNQGDDQWWAHSVYFPDDYIVPPANPYNWGVIMDFHHTQAGGGQANIQLISLADGLVFWVSGGTMADPQPRTEQYLGPIVKNQWYDYVYHIRWSSGSDGVFEAWQNGFKKMNYRGPTLYSGQGTYLKLANYHSPINQPVAVVHGRLLRGTGPIVSLSPLQP